jgi:hypothetical protein
MPDQDFKSDIYAYGAVGRVAYGQFTTAGTGAVTGFTAGNGVESVSRTGVGTFEITLAHRALAYQPVGLNVGGAAAVQLGRPSVRSITLSTKKIVVAMVESDAAPIDIETTGVTVYFTVLCVGF